MMAAHVVDIDVVMADGSQKTVNRFNDPDFYYYILGYGGVAIITRMTMRVVP